MLEDFCAERRKLARSFPLPEKDEVLEWLKAHRPRQGSGARPAWGVRVNAGGVPGGISLAEGWRPGCAFVVLAAPWVDSPATGTGLSADLLHERIKGLRGSVAAFPVEWGLELTGADPRLPAEVAAAAGLLTWRGGPLESYLVLGRTGTFPQLVEHWSYVEGLAQFYGGAGAKVRREVRGLRGTALVPPGLAVALVLIEAGLAVAAGTRELSLAYAPCGHLLQDVAAMNALARLAPPGLTVDVTCLLWSGGALTGHGGAAAAAAWTGLTAVLGGAERAEVAALDGQRNPGEPQNLLAQMAVLARLAGDQRRAFLTAVQREEELIAAEAGAIVSRIEELGAGDLRAGVMPALAEGSLDVPLAPSGVCRGQVLAARDQEGAVRFLDPGHLPLPPAAKEYHRAQLERRAQAEGREPGVSMVIDDIYALNKGFLVGRPE